MLFLLHALCGLASWSRVGEELWSIVYQHLSEGTNETRKNLSQAMVSGRDLNPGPLGHMY
jgi:hypothetical protein